MIKEQIETGRYVDPTSDFGFKFYFGRQENKDLLIMLLNGLFHGEKVITDLHYTLSEEDGNTEDERRVIFDIRCTGADGEQFIIEMQKINQQFFKDRMIFYTSRAISSLVEKGKNGDNFYLPEVYFIGVLEFPLGRHYFHDIALQDQKTNELFYEKLGYKLLCLPNFTKTGPELDGPMDQWLYTLKNISQLKKMPKYLDAKVIGRMFDLGEIGKLNADELMKYQDSIKHKMDTEAAFAYVREEAEKKGEEKGLKEGEEKAKKGIVRHMMQSLSMSNEQIADLTGVSLSFVEAVRAALDQDKQG